MSTEETNVPTPEGQAPVEPAQPVAEAPASKPVAADAAQTVAAAAQPVVAADAAQPVGAAALPTAAPNAAQPVSADAPKPAAAKPAAAKPPVVKKEKKKKKPLILAVIDQPGCTGCEACIPFCPVDCIEIVPGPAGPNNVFLQLVEVELERCIGCQLCAKACPWETIEMLPYDQAFEFAPSWTVRPHVYKDKPYAPIVDEKEPVNA